MTTIDWAIVVGLNSLVFGFAALRSLKTKSDVDWFLGGRSLPFWLVGMSMFATSVDGGGGWLDHKIAWIKFAIPAAASTSTSLLGGAGQNCGLRLCFCSPATESLLCCGENLQMSRSQSDIRLPHGLRVPMRDGVQLSADVFQPQVTAPYPTIVIRTPYESGRDVFIELGVWWAERGYAFVVQDCRGRFESEGVF